MTYTSIRNHQFCIIYIQENKVESFQKELHSYISNNELELSKWNQRNNKITFTLTGIAQKINEFVQKFAKEWHVQEMGVSEFARIMEISDEEAEEWYDLINSQHNQSFSLTRLEHRILSKYIPIENIEKLKYLKSHFQGHVAEGIETRIRYLMGFEDEYSKHIKRELEIQELLKSIEPVIQEDKEEVTVNKQQVEQMIKLIREMSLYNK